MGTLPEIWHIAVNNEVLKEIGQVYNKACGKSCYSEMGNKSWLYLKSHDDEGNSLESGCCDASFSESRESSERLIGSTLISLNDFRCHFLSKKIDVAPLKRVNPFLVDVRKI